MYGSVVLKKEATQRAPWSAAMAATQWCAGPNRIWRRAGASWRCLWTERGGWQGSQRAQMHFAMSLEGDHLHAIATPFELAETLSQLKIALQASGKAPRQTPGHCSVPSLGIQSLPLPAKDGGGRRKARRMLTKVAMHALDYDAKLIPSTGVHPNTAGRSPQDGAGQRPR